MPTCIILLRVDSQRWGKPNIKIPKEKEAKWRPGRDIGLGVNNSVEKVRLLELILVARQQRRD